MATQTLDANGNVVVDGLSTNLSPTQAQTSGAIPVSSLQTQTPINVPTGTATTPDYAATLAAEVVGAQQNVNDVQSQYGNIYSSLLGSQSQLGNKLSDQQGAYETGGVNTSADQLRKLNAQIQALGLQNQSIPLQTQQEYAGRLSTQAGTEAIDTGKRRELALQALAIGQQAALAQADYQTAKDKADRMIELKYAQVENDINTKKMQLDYLDKVKLTPAQERLKQAQQNAIKQREAAVAEQKATESSLQDIGMTLRKYGASDSVVKDVLNSKTIKEAILKAGNNLQDPKAKLELQSLKADIALKYAQAAKANREAQLSKEPTMAEKKAAALAVTQAKSSAQAAQDKIESINNILTYDAGISSRVGPNVLARGIVGPAVGGAITGGATASVVPGVGTLVGAGVGGVLGAAKGIGSALSGQGQQLSGAVHQLTAGLTLKELQDAKANGATFGSLTDGERNMLAAAATKLNDWEVKDSQGNPTGYWNIDEASFRKELQTIQELNRKALLKSQGTLISPDEKSLLDSAFPEEQPSASQYY